MAEETKTEETKKEQPSFEEFINTYVDPEVAARQLADVAIQRAQIARDVANLQARAAELEVIERVVERQMCNKAPEA